MTRLAPVFAATTFIVGVVAIYLWQQLHEAHGLLAKQQGVQPTALLSQCPVQSPTVAMVPTASANAITSPGQSSAGVPATDSSCSSQSADVLNRLMPNFRRAQARMKVQARAELAKQIPDFARELGLNPSEAEAFLDLLSNHETMRNSIPYSVAGNDEALKLELQYAKAELSRMQNAELEALIGAAGVEKWNEYKPTVTARQVVIDFRSMIAQAPPLTDEQERLLIAPVHTAMALPKESAPVPASSAGASSALDSRERSLKFREEQVNRLIAATQGILSAQQQAALKDSLEKQLSDQRKSLEAARARQASFGSPTTPTSR